MASKSWHGTLERLGATFSAGGPFIALEAFYNPVYSYKQKNSPSLSLSLSLSYPHFDILESVKPALKLDGAL